MSPPKLRSLIIQKLYEEATQVASDAVGNIRTVASFCAEDNVMELHQKKCAGPVKLTTRHGLLSGAGFGMSFFLLYSVYAASYYVGARLVDARRISFGDVFRVSSNILFVDNLSCFDFLFLLLLF